VKKTWKLSTAQKAQIARRYANGELAGHLAAEFGVTRWTVCVLVQNRNPPMRSKSQVWDDKVIRLRDEGKIVGAIPSVK
jgi:hypothetical protein